MNALYSELNKIEKGTPIAQDVIKIKITDDTGQTIERNCVGDAII